MVDVIGAGFGRTGTASLKTALEMLGFGPCHHMVDVIKNPDTAAGWIAAMTGDAAVLPELVGKYRSTQDFPGALLWREMMDLYPDAKVLLSVRDPQKWYDSARATILNQDLRQHMEQAVLPDARKLADMMLSLADAMAGRGFHSDLGEQEMIAFFQQHNESVRATVDPEKLLVYEVGQGWDPLCAFLGVDVPDKPFPRGNESGVFAEKVRRLTAGETVDEYQ